MKIILFLIINLLWEKKVYRGVSNEELDYYNRNGDLGNFFSDNIRFVEDYGDVIIECKLLTNNVFNSHDDRNLQKIYDNGFKLYDSYSDTTFETLSEFIDNPISDSDMWDVIENTEGLLDWIMSEYDVCYMSEGGLSTFYIDNPSVYEVISIN